MLEPILKKKSKGKVKFGTPTSRLLSAPPVGDDSVVGRVAVPVTAGGFSVTLNFNLRFVRVGRGIQILVFLAAPGTFNVALEGKLTRTATNRLKAELAHP